jgi:hypothetical protein
LRLCAPFFKKKSPSFVSDPAKCPEKVGMDIEAAFDSVAAVGSVRHRKSFNFNP